MSRIFKYRQTNFTHCLVHSRFNCDKLVMNNRIPRFGIVSSNLLQTLKLVIVLICFPQIIQFGCDACKLFQYCLRNIRYIFDLGNLILDPYNLIIEKHERCSQVFLCLSEFLRKNSRQFLMETFYVLKCTEFFTGKESFQIAKGSLKSLFLFCHITAHSIKLSLDTCPLPTIIN